MNNKQINKPNTRGMNLVAICLSLWMAGVIGFLFRVISPRYLFGARDVLVFVYIAVVLLLYFLSKMFVKRETWSNFIVRFVVIFVVLFLANGFIRAMLDL